MVSLSAFVVTDLAMGVGLVALVVTWVAGFRALVVIIIFAGGTRLDRLVVCMEAALVTDAARRCSRRRKWVALELMSMLAGCSVPSVFVKVSCRFRYVGLAVKEKKTK